MFDSLRICASAALDSIEIGCRATTPITASAMNVNRNTISRARRVLNRFLPIQGLSQQDRNTELSFELGELYSRQSIIAPQTRRPYGTSLGPFACARWTSLTECVPSGNSRNGTQCEVSCSQVQFVAWKSIASTRMQTNLSAYKGASHSAAFARFWIPAVLGVDRWGCFRGRPISIAMNGEI